MMDEAREQALTRELARGCPLAYAELYGRFGARLYRAACTMLGSSADAEDAVQDVFVSLVRSRHRLAAVESLAAYLFTSLRHVVDRRLGERQRRRQAMRGLSQQSKEAVFGSPAPPDEPLEHALAGLPEQQREVIALKIDGGLTFAQIGAVLGISINTAASRYRYALEKLRAALGDKAN